MGALFLTTILSCSQVLSVAQRLANISFLTAKQKTEIIVEIQKTVPSCPVIIKQNDSKRK